MHLPAIGGGRMYKRKLHKEISSGLLVLIAALSLAGCGKVEDALKVKKENLQSVEDID